MKIKLHHLVGVIIAIFIASILFSIEKNINNANEILESAADNNAQIIDCSVLQNGKILIMFVSSDRNLERMPTITHTTSKLAFGFFQDNLDSRNWECDESSVPEDKRTTWTFTPRTKYDTLDKKLSYALKYIKAKQVDTIFYLPNAGLKTSNDIGIVRLLGYYELTGGLGTKLSEENWKRFVKIAEQDGWQFGKKHKYHGLKHSIEVIKGTHPEYRTQY